MARNWIWRKFANQNRRQSSPGNLTDVTIETTFMETRARTTSPTDVIEDGVFFDPRTGPFHPMANTRARARSTPALAIPSARCDSSTSFSLDDTDSSLPSSVEQTSFIVPTFRDAASTTDLTKGHVDNFEREIEDLRLQLEKAQDETKCIVCWHNKRAVMFSPCHHVVACAKCADKLPGVHSMDGGFKHCPLCRRAIEKRTKVYLG